MPGYPVVPGLFVLCTLSFAGLAALQRPLEALVGAATMFTGVILYLCCARPVRRSAAPDVSGSTP
jgi:hypothetical protein